MHKQEIQEELRAIIQEYLKRKGLELVDLIYRYEGRDSVLRVFADRPEGGISLGECACLNRDISAILDERDILKERYLLEVSSPGADRPLKTKSDFLRCLNKPLKLFLNEPIKGKLEVDGIINKVEGESLYIDISAEIIGIPILKINKAKQIIGNV